MFNLWLKKKLGVQIFIESSAPEKGVLTWFSYVENSMIFPIHYGIRACAISLKFNRMYWWLCTDVFNTCKRVRLNGIVNRTAYFIHLQGVESPRLIHINTRFADWTLNKLPEIQKKEKKKFHHKNGGANKKVRNEKNSECEVATFCWRVQ